MIVCSFNSKFPWLTYIVLSKKLKDLIKKIVVRLVIEVN